MPWLARMLRQARPRWLVVALVALAADGPAWAATVEISLQSRDGRPLVDAVAWLDSREAKAAVRPSRRAEVPQRDRQFTQRVSVVALGTEVAFPNQDKVRHHVYSVSPKRFDLKLFLGNEANPVLFDRPGVAVLGCNIHDEMIAWVVVVETPYFGATSVRQPGRLRLDNVPPGSYRLLAWHPGLAPGAPALEQALSVPAAGASATVTLAVAAE